VAIYIANENGDWWELTDKAGSTLYVLDTDKLTNAEKVELIDEWGNGFDLATNTESDIPELLPSAFAHNKVDYILWQHGTPIKLELDKLGER
jgi:hypothetical protein